VHVNEKAVQNERLFPIANQGNSEATLHSQGIQAG